MSRAVAASDNSTRKGMLASSAKRHAVPSGAGSRQWRRALSNRRQAQQRPGQEVDRQLDEVLPGVVGVAGAVVEGRRCLDMREAPGEVVPEERSQGGGAIRPQRHGPQPRPDDEYLQEKARVQLPAAQLRQRRSQR